MSKEDTDALVIRRLDAIVRLLALRLTEGMKTGEKIRLLGRAGLDRSTIAEIAESTPDAVSVRLAEAKRQRRARPAPAAQAPEVTHEES